MKCPNPKCNEEVQANWKVCPFCQTQINPSSGVTPPGGIIDSVVKADRVVMGDYHEAPDPSKRKSATHTGILCPICYRLAKDDWFECPECKKKYICIKHQDSKTNKCISCVKKSQSELIQSSSELGIGAIVANRYKIISVIGEGGMGTVFKAVDQNLSRDVAIKCLSGENREEQTGIERFMQEAKSIAKLSHLNIVQVYDVSKSEKIPFICMELLDGKPLDLLIKEKGMFSPEEVLPFIKGIGNALSYAHKRQVIHRDVKPANVIRNSEGIFKLLDFGLARVGQSSDLSRTGYGLGTEAYASPEQKRDAKNVDYRTDIYSLGATTYEMLTNKSPTAPRENKLPSEIANVIMKALEPSVEQRYFTIDEFIKDYEEKLSTPAQKKPVISEDTVGQCLECSNVNSEDSQYCEKCGAGLFEKCLSCQKEFRIGKEFCPGCGVNISDYRKYRDHLDKGKDYLQKHKYSRAVKEFKLAQEINISEKELQPLISEAEYSLKEIDQLTKKAKKLFEGQRYMDAEEVLHKALTLDPESAWLRQTKASIPTKIKDKKVQDILAQAKSAFGENNYKLAKEYLEQAKLISPHNEEVKQLATEIEKTVEKRRSKRKKILTRFSWVTVVIIAISLISYGQYTKWEDGKVEYKVYLEAKKKLNPGLYLKNYGVDSEYSLEMINLKDSLDDLAYNKISGPSSVEKLEEYLSRFPDGKHASNVQDRIKTINSKKSRSKDDAAFASATKANTIRSYRAYINNYPKGAHVSKIRLIIKDEEAYRIALQNNSIESYEKYFDKFPNGRNRYNATGKYNDLKYPVKEIWQVVKNVEYSISSPGDSKKDIIDFSKVAIIWRKESNWSWSGIGLKRNLYCNKNVEIKGDGVITDISLHYKIAGARDSNGRNIGEERGLLIKNKITGKVYERITVKDHTWGDKWEYFKIEEKANCVIIEPIFGHKEDIISIYKNCRVHFEIE